MPFPNCDRVIYKCNPLTEVICQVRFPRLLLLEDKLPTQFQQLISNEYPHLEELRSQEIDVNSKSETKVISEKPLFRFISRDHIWQFTIASDFLSITTNQYEKWEDFEDRLNNLLGKFLQIYDKIDIFTRIGLRYKNLIVKSKLGLNDRNWDQLVNTKLLGSLADPIINANIIRANSVLLMNLNEGDKLLIQHGLVEKENESCYLIDSDFFLEKSVELDDAKNTLRRFNKKSGCVFKWCIQDDLYRAMEPRPISRD